MRVIVVVVVVVVGGVAVVSSSVGVLVRVGVKVGGRIGKDVESSST